ncbi:MAG: type 4b pilus protein PilO2 [Alphaproteobacteria bacterium]
MENADNIPTEQETQEQHGSSGTIIVDGITYAVGLMWQSLQNADDPLPEIREVSESEPGLDLYCVRMTSAPQYGIGRKSMGHREGQPSAAAALASTYAEKSSVCAVFRLKEGWWFVSIRNDLILSEEDRLFTREEDAQRAFFSMMAVPDWEVKIAPRDWGIEGADQVDLAEVLKNARIIRLSEISAARRTEFLIIAAIVILVILTGIIYLLSTLAFWETVFTQEKIVSVPAPQVIKPVEPAPEKPKPWEKVPEIMTFLNKCWNNSYQLNNLTIPGWKLGSVICTPQGIDTSWSKSWNPGGRIAWLKAAINEYKISRVSIQLDENGTAAKGNIVFTALPSVASIPTLTDQQIREELQDISQATNLPIQFSKQTVLDPPNNPDGSVPPNQQTYVFYSFVVTSNYTPWEWKVFFDKFSGLELLKIEYNPAVEATTNKWKYEGRIYAK